jgi:multidrug resistance efflux pump
MVRPGDSVREGQILGQMDSHDLSIQLAAITADSERMRKSYDVNLASGKVAAAQIDRLELERLEQQKELLEHRMSNLAIRSPVEGYVIGGDLKRKEGSPLTLGQVLYEIAPLDQMCVELSIDQSDIASVKMGQEVSIRFEAWGGESLVGHLARIHPRSEIRESRNVFIAEVVLADSNEQLRPGMRGEARIAVAGENMATAIGKRWWHRLVSYWGF